MPRETLVIKGKYIVWFGLPVLVVTVFSLLTFVVYMTKARPPRKGEAVVQISSPSTAPASGAQAPAPTRETGDPADSFVGAVAPSAVPRAGNDKAPVTGGAPANASGPPPPPRMHIPEPAISSYSGSSWKLPLSSEGWSEFAPSADSNTVYVSSGTGSDKGVGREDAPVRTLRRGVELLRKNRGDRLLLKRGDSWDETFGNWAKSGESPEFPMIVGAYGTGPRPRIVTGDRSGLAIHTKRGPAVKYLALKELDFTAARAGPDKPGCAISCLGEADHVLVEDCRFSGYAGGLVFQVFEGGAISNVTLRRCIVLDSHNSTSHSQGIFCSGVEGLTIEECLFDHNGWSDAHPQAVQTMFNHNVYIQTGGRDTIFRGNISARASSHGIQARCGGLVADNLFFECPLAILLGGGDAPIPGPISGRVSGNVILNGNDIADAPRGNAIEVNNLDAGAVTVIADNIAAQVRSKRKGFAVILDSLPGRNGYAGIHHALVRDNIVHDWGMPLRLVGTEFSQVRIEANRFTVSDARSPLVEFHLAEWTTPARVEFFGNRYSSNVPAKDAWFTGLPPDKRGAWRADFEAWADKTAETGAVERLTYADPGRSLATYAKSIGLDESPGDFLEAVRNRQAGAWPADYTAGAVIAYIREGFTPGTN